MSKKIAWYIPFILVAVLLAACDDRESGGPALPIMALPTDPTLDLSVPRVYKTDYASVIRYFDPLQCASNGKATITIQPDMSSKLEVVSPDVVAAYVNKVGGDLKCSETGDWHIDTFYGVYDPTTRAILMKTCDVDGISSDIIEVTSVSVGGGAACKFMIAGKAELWVSVAIQNADLSK